MGWMNRMCKESKKNHNDNGFKRCSKYINIKVYYAGSIQLDQPHTWKMMKTQLNKQNRALKFWASNNEMSLLQMCVYLVQTKSIPVASAQDHLSEHLKMREEHIQMERAHSWDYLV